MEMFGDKLKSLRNHKNLTLEKAAIGIGIKAQTLSSYENGYRFPGIKTLIKLAKYYDSSIDYLIGVDNNLDKRTILNELENIEKQVSKLKEHIKRS